MRRRLLEIQRKRRSRKNKEEGGRCVGKREGGRGGREGCKRKRERGGNMREGVAT